ncbi:Putative transposable element [Caligus rogercresseyi]|uniref:Transposable element n=1 Tax=Caligus rogercresseyi TaxID=217165 RepID=A0A7T8GZ54_CALRO|nr:Putative transposable element [Caligus rogercresseyi]
MDPGWRTVPHLQESPGFLSCQHGRFLARRHVAKFESGFKPTRLFCLERLGESCLQDISRKLTSLQQAIVEAWDNLTEEYIKKSCASVRRRVEAVIANNGGHIE